VQEASYYEKKENAMW